MRGRVAAYPDPVLHFDALRPAALREGGGIKEALATENERKIVNTRTCARTLSPRSFLLLGKASSPLPARSANWLGGPCSASCSSYLGG